MVRSYHYEDDEAQVDGDAPVAFVSRNPGAGQPWLRGSMPPWHMWGNSVQIVITQFEQEAVLPPVVTGQVIKIAYKRPETWHWVFHARILDPAIRREFIQPITVELHWDLVLGHGRSQVTIPDFDHWRWAWTTSTMPTPTAPKWATQTLTPSLFDSIVDPIGPDAATRRQVLQIDGQDIQLNCRAHAFFDSPILPGENITMEVSAFFAPKAHVRPDWFCDGPVEVQYPGDEIGGR